MPTKVLVFESEAAFAEELKDGLSRFGCETTVVDDANVGLQAAANDRPDLILLSIELPRMNGFSVCNKLKRNPDLKAVPLIIMSSDSTEETFEQHRRLRTRAEDYVHKPLAFGELLKHIRQFVPLTADMSEVPVSEDAIVVEDDLVIEEADVQDAVIDAEVEDFAEQAFDALIDDAATAVSPGASAAGGAPAPAHAAQPDESIQESPESLAPDDIQLDEDDIRDEGMPEPEPEPEPEPAVAPAPEPEPEPAGPDPRVEQLAGELSAANAQVAEFEKRVADLEDRLRSEATRKDAEIVSLQEELDATKKKLTQAASGKSATSAREFLDLREALNKKDKEILDLRDQITHRDKELLNIKDSSLALEREKADLDDKLLEFERQLLDERKQADANRADKEQAAKRADDFKRKAEKLQGEIDSRAQEITALKEKHEGELAQRDAAQAHLRVEHQQALESAQEKAQQELAEALESARATAESAQSEAVAAARAEADGEKARALSEREAELQKGFDSKIAALHRANEDAMNKLRADHEQSAKEAADAEARLTSELASANDALANLSKEKEESEAARDAKIASLESELAGRLLERDQGRKDLQERDSKIITLEAELASAREDLTSTQAELGATRAKLVQAQSKWSEDRASLEGAKDALAAALAKIEEVEQRSID